MLKSQHIILIFLPAVLLVSIIFGIRVFQYKVLFWDTAKTPDETPVLDLIPILPEDPIIGKTSAPHTIIAFEDFGCEGCKAQNTILKEIELQHPGKVKIIWKGLPVATFPYSSEPAHEYAFCANAQGQFDAYKELAFANHTNLSKNTLDMITQEIELDPTILQTCLSSEKPLQYIDTNRQLARILHVQHVPTFFIDDAQVAAPSTREGWEAILGL